MICELKDTIQLMISSDYKQRFVAQYWQTKIRYEKLKDFCNKIEASELTKYDIDKRYVAPQHDCSLVKLREQQNVMGQYLHILEIRAVIEGIDLSQPIKSNDTVFEV